LALILGTAEQCKDTTNSSCIFFFLYYFILLPGIVPFNTTYLVYEFNVCNWLLIDAWLVGKWFDVVKVIWFFYFLLESSYIVDI